MIDHFRTILTMPAYPFKILPADKILCLGSCFAENIAQKLAENKFQFFLNPFGIQYNPYSLGQSILRLLHPRPYTDEDVFFANERWQSFDFHSKMASPEKTTALHQMNQSLRQAVNFLDQTQLIILSLGTAFVFEHIERQRIVANCHKIPNKAFIRKKINLEDTIKYLKGPLEELFQRYPQLHVLLTVSPIRHIKDGHIDNQRSKSTLLLATEQLEKTFKNVYYFPSYEFMMDDLRDYRFYDLDLIHPHPLAIEYIWKNFCHALMDPSSLNLMARITPIMKASQHRPFNAQSQKHQVFVKQQLQKITLLEQSFEHLDLNMEKSIFHQQLNKGKDK